MILPPLLINFFSGTQNKTKQKPFSCHSVVVFSSWRRLGEGIVGGGEREKLPFVCRDCGEKVDIDGAKRFIFSKFPL